MEYGGLGGGGFWGSVFIRCNNNLKRFVSNLDWVCCNLVVLRSSRSAAGSSCGLAMFVCWSANTDLQMSLAYLSSSVMYTCCWGVDCQTCELFNCSCSIQQKCISQSCAPSIVKILQDSDGQRETERGRLKFGFVHAQLLKLHTQVSLSCSIGYSTVVALL